MKYTLPMINCSKRIQLFSELLMPCDTLCDIGCDHGYMSILALTDGKARRVLACDINEGPLQKASENIRDCGLSDRAELILSDGFREIHEPFDACIICGMGGLLIRNILREAGEKLSGVRQMILSPHSEAYALRKYLAEETSFTIRRETCVKDAGHFYTAFDVRRKEDGMCPEITERDLLFGNPALETDSAVYREMTEDLLQKNRKALSMLCGNDSERVLEKKEELTRKESYLLSILES